MTYSYDDLHRLTYAAATKTGGLRTYRQQFSYDALGNFTYKSDQGTYQYNGNQGASYANPHAVTTIDGRNALTYDRNGNLESAGKQIFYTWDYNNRLRQANAGGLIVIYDYTSDGERVRYNRGFSQTISPTRFYSVSTTSGIEKHVFAGNMVLATIKGMGQQAQIYYDHTDHLSGANIVTHESGNIVERLEYYPFGSILLDTAPLQERRKFAGHEYDLETGLSYMTARYYDGAKGRFFSQDPIYLEVGSSAFTKKWNNNWRDIKSNELNDSYDQFDRLRKDKVAKTALREYLSNPQHLNSYSYVTNNPLKYIDPTGEWEVHLNFLETNLGLGGEAGNSWTIGFASDGIFGVSTSFHGGGLAGVDASIGISAGYSNAKTWGDTLGIGQYVTAGGKILGGGSVTTNFSDGKYTGTDVGIGLGARGVPPIPVAFSGGVTKTFPAYQGNASGIANGFKNVKNNVTNTVNKTANTTVNTVKQGWQKTTNYFKKIGR